MNDMVKVRARPAEAGFFADAEARVRLIERRLAVSPVNDLALALQDAPEPARKFYWLRQITDMLGLAAAGVAPCKSGCDACCHMATMISRTEAEAIAQASGRAMTEPPEAMYGQDITIDQAKFLGVPCSFLEDHRCTIYADRPHACRVHYSLDRDKLLCQIVPGELVRVPSYDNSRFNLLFLLAHGDPREAKMADIREFFPPRTGKK